MGGEGVLIADGRGRGPLAVARGLNQAGFRVAVAAPAHDWPVPAQWSRAVEKRLTVPSPNENEEGFLTVIQETVRSGDYAILLAGGDAALLALSRGRDGLEPYVRCRLPPHSQVERSLDKLELISVASRHGLTAPPSVHCHDHAEAVRAARHFGYPAFVKPTRSVVAVSGALRRLGSRLVRNASELEDAVSSCSGSCIVQRFQNGAVLSFAGTFLAGRLLGQALSRYQRTWRPDAGGVSFSTTVPAPDGLETRVTSLLDDIGWEGLFELELIERPGGEWAVIDLNPRIYGSIALAIGAGANLPAIWCDCVMGRDPQRARARSGVSYRWDEGDLGHALSQIRDGKLIAAARTLRPHRGVVHSHFRASDPGPLLALVVLLARTRRRRPFPSARGEDLELTRSAVDPERLPL